MAHPSPSLVYCGTPKAGLTGKELKNPGKPSQVCLQVYLNSTRIKVHHSKGRPQKKSHAAESDEGEPKKVQTALPSTADKTWFAIRMPPSLMASQSEGDRRFAPQLSDMITGSPARCTSPGFTCSLSGDRPGETWSSRTRAGVSSTLRQTPKKPEAGDRGCGRVGGAAGQRRGFPGRAPTREPLPCFRSKKD
ncbi:hypothetical protein GWK47_040322 [Chionoecetes opilio]|uniref:Uncharacterized protein n=1 Tax=Chionoecetes opilio TaxID=41210 RepID=A0A8J4YCC0_CHIOP|nr:hypothetical protein GWK47_040322 [Chionoecetes opilio]